MMSLIRFQNIQTLDARLLDERSVWLTRGDTNILYDKQDADKKMENGYFRFRSALNSIILCASNITSADGGVGTKPIVIHAYSYTALPWWA